MYFETVCKKLSVPIVAFGTGWEASDESGGRSIILQLADRERKPNQYNLNIEKDAKDRLITALKAYQYGGFRGSYTKAVADMLFQRAKIVSLVILGYWQIGY